MLSARLGQFLSGPAERSPSPPSTLSIGPEQWEMLRKALGTNVAKETVYRGPELWVESDGQTVKLFAVRHSHTQRLQYGFAAQAMSNGFECSAVLDAHKLPSLPGPYRVTVYSTFAEFRQADYNVFYWVGSQQGVRTWGGKRLYQAMATRTTSQQCCIPVEAHSPEEAEALARQVGTFDWREEPGQRIELKALIQ